MKARLAALVALSLAGCDFGGAFEAYCAETGRCAADAGADGGADAGANTDAGLDAGVDAGFDAGLDAGSDAGHGLDAGAPDAAVPMDAGSGSDAGDPLSGANQGDGGVLPGCAMSSFFVGAGFDGVANECVLQSVLAQKPNGAGSDLGCSLPVTVVSVPAGVSLFRDTSCAQTPTVSSIKGIRADRFGDFQWFVSATSGGFTVSSSVARFTATAGLTVSPVRLPLDQCTLVEVVARDVQGAPVAAATQTPVSLSLRQGSAVMASCGGVAQFAAGASVMLVGVRPTSLTEVTLTAAGALFVDGGVTAALAVCAGPGATCSSSPDCCQGACSSNQCQ
ncbi:MAG: hypothetical protein ACOZQL_24240 [Myxococcota bacterium]